jgi:N-acetylglucosaminyl-diphospho-decaprenol L-rhamnosyltransferase
VSEAGPALGVVIVTYNNARQIGATLEALADQLRDGDELMVVDNASADETREVVRAAGARPRLRALARNVGFAAGCNEGAMATSAPLLLFLNPDSRPAPGCLDALRRTAVERPAWGAWQALVTMADGAEINSAGNVTHFLGMGWAGRCGEPVTAAPREPEEVGFASGAALVVRREAWNRAGRFDAGYFMYGEDLDLGLRLWLTGWGVGVEPRARVEHEYEFAKGGTKWFLLERNRWRTVLSDYPAGLLAPLMPALLAAELALLAVSARDGWLGAKLRSQAAVIRGLPDTLRRRRTVQASRTTGAAELAARLSASLDSPYLPGVARMPLLPRLQRAYWAAVRACLGRPCSPDTLRHPPWPREER